ncbi:LCP family protein required for cell wall assembly [Peribacillus deserti]|uniref:Regulatory protein MsrR n=1 Tax=Peribacillus deserti TaxID=673318 RepID=A0ABS2QFD3_9BACI|nr:LCP family protein [Peribacillus deserti]MBM7691016.1 LCP family protein required for cell wall assembly [Peribacillus deserti]
MGRVEQRGKKRHRKTRTILLILLLLIIAGLGYAFFQYNQGLNMADVNDAKSEANHDESFKGEEVQYGQINVLLIGSDTRGEGAGLSDSIMIAHYDQESHEPKLVSIMRDTYVNIPGGGMRRINSAFSNGGPELLRQTIKENFNVDINYYAIVNFAGFSKVVDILAPNGIEVDVPHTMREGIDMTLKPGRQVLHGDELLGYVRFRKDAQGDFGRVARQQEVIGKLKNEAMSVTSIMKLPKLIGVINPYVDTNIDSGTILSLSKDVLFGNTKDTQNLRIPVDGSFRDARINGAAVLEIDIEENKQALHEFLDSKN